MTSPADDAPHGTAPGAAAPEAAAPEVAGRRAADVVLRPLVAADLDVLEDLEEALFGAGAWSRTSLAEEITGPGRWYVGAQDRASGELVGYAGLWFDGYDGQVMTVGTRPDVQGRGVGRMLLDALLAHARELGAGDVLLEVRVDNEPALRLYEGAGFERFGRRKGYYQPENVDAWTMRRRA
ncbi:ribosomal protein S18-alanine N-acetyltransferase [Cellulomonas sp. IC4_254]|uniref:ribosomal protein S18-alanine N-acetyltransferase n=1 Tax=Cellulomonas sp. IC4_254 TaxID=2714040 RepID=UPI00142162CB|nr:ribosomal protein S18-alanine N-acetyltransferase [Cellulomonas sp. IC4_254]NHT16285.1 ribosomal protein S18-alanine N-acetyltransferase [Cellulomonas sp. IC4_254]